MGRAFEFRKARKMKRWSAMAKTFTRIGKDIVMAVKDGGPAPESNSKLRAVIQNAKSANMPKENIERAISKSELNKGVNFNSIIYEGFGPDTAQNVEYRFNRHTLSTKDVYPEIGDIIFHNEAYFEISNVREDQMIGGRSGNRFSIICSTPNKVPKIPHPTASLGVISINKINKIGANIISKFL